MCQTRLKGGPNWWVAAVLRGERSKAAVASTLLVRPEGHPQFRSAPAARQYSISVGGHVQLINKHVSLSTRKNFRGKHLECCHLQRAALTPKIEP